MRKFRQVLAIAGLAVIAFFYIRFFVQAAAGSASSGSDLALALAATIIIPVVMYIITRLSERIGQTNEPTKED